MRKNATGLLCVSGALALAAWLLIFPALLRADSSNTQVDVIKTSGGELRVRPLYHGSVMLEFGGKVIHVDPWSQADYDGIPQADLIVITHTHADHMDAPIINRLKKTGTIILGPPAVTDTLNGAVGETDAIANGETKAVLGVRIEAVPM